MAISCQRTRESSDAFGIKKLLAGFPASELTEVVDEVTESEFVEVVTIGESKNWTRTVLDEVNQEVVIRHRVATDNSVRFVVYETAGHEPMLGVQQVNAQVSRTQIWKLSGASGGEWIEYPMPVLRLEDFFDERVVLPESYQGSDALPYEDIELSPGKVQISLNKWSYMRDLESNSIQPEGPLNPALVKYNYLLQFRSGAFDSTRVLDPGFEEVIRFVAMPSEEDPDGPGIHEFDCAHGVQVTSSSALAPQRRNQYKPSNVLDRSESTAWSEGVSGSGIGEWLEFTITSDYLIGGSWGVSNGYTKDKDTWQANNRVKKLEVLVDDQFIGHVLLSNSMEYQLFEIAPSWLRTSPRFRKGTRIRFRIIEVYPGTQYNDTLISHLVPTGNCG